VCRPAASFLALALLAEGTAAIDTNTSLTFIFKMIDFDKVLLHFGRLSGSFHLRPDSVVSGKGY